MPGCDVTGRSDHLRGLGLPGSGPPMPAEATERERFPRTPRAEHVPQRCHLLPCLAPPCILTRRGGRIEASHRPATASQLAKHLYSLALPDQATIRLGPGAIRVQPSLINQHHPPVPIPPASTSWPASASRPRRARRRTADSRIRRTPRDRLWRQT